jgi:YggT family protein
MSPSPVGQIIILVLWIFLILLIGRLILDYVQMFARSWRPRGPLLVVAEAVYTITDPPLKALRRVIPPLKIGSVSLDLGFLVLFVLVNIGIWLAGYL